MAVAPRSSPRGSESPGHRRPALGGVVAGGREKDSAARAPAEGFAEQWHRAIRDLRRPLAVVQEGDAALPSASEAPVSLGRPPAAGELPVVAWVPPLAPASLGDASFLEQRGVTLPYAAGAMANGIASVELVEAVARAGGLAFFGAAGLAPTEVDRALGELRRRLGDAPGWGVNLIHNPAEPDVEAQHAELMLRHRVREVEASAYLDLTLPVVRARLVGLRRGRDGEPRPARRLMAKVSRTEVAERFLSPAPRPLVEELVRRGDLDASQAELALRLPLADDITAEADSGGHTDNRPAIGLLPTLRLCRDRLQREHGFARAPRVGAAGGIATPASAAAAFALGAAYVVVGSVHQACVESGSSDRVRELLAACGPADVAMAPAADMFEMGVRVQVLKRGTLFAMRAGRLYELYRAHESVEALPEKERQNLEERIFRLPIAEVWRRCEEFFGARDPAQLERAARDPRHRMALVFRWYLGVASTWANRGDPDRVADYQVWCGPAMGAFNEWARGSHLEQPAGRRVHEVMWNLLYGAAVETRCHQLRLQGVVPPAESTAARPVRADSIAEYFDRSAEMGVTP